MTFKPGNKLGVKGRTKGIKDKRHQYYDVQAKLREMGHDPIQAIIEMAQDPLVDAALRFKANQELVSKISPTVKAIEQRPDDKTVDDIEYLTETMEQLVDQNRLDK